MKRVLLLVVILMLVLPQILIWSNPSSNRCCSQLRLENLAYAYANGYVNVARALPAILY